MSWYPDRLLVVNVRGRALISDHYIMGEWRRDPWRGFDLPEGAWRRTRRHEYEPAVLHEWGGVTGLRDAVPITDAAARRTIRGCLEKILPAPGSIVTRSPDKDREGSNGSRFHAFAGPLSLVYVDPDSLAALVHLIDGEPEWRNDGEYNAMHAVDETGHWLGAIMPVRMPKPFLKGPA